MLCNLLAGKADALKKIEKFDPNEIGISIVTIGEIYEGAYNSSNPDAKIEKFYAFLKNFEVVPLSLPIIKRFAEIRAHLRRSGQIISDIDIFLAATALHHDLTVLTFNTKHFARIPNLKIF